MDIKMSKPHFLRGSFNNIPMAGTWNKGLAKGLADLAEEIQHNGDSDIFDVEVERNDNYQEFDSYGSIGYVFPVENETSDERYYYIEFSLSPESSNIADTENENLIFKAFNEKLGEYLQHLQEDTLIKCQYIKSDDGQKSVLKAFFVGK